MSRWKFFAKTEQAPEREVKHHDSVSTEDPEAAATIQRKPPKWSLGILQDKETDEVPGMRAIPYSESQLEYRI
jgi:hypothetical protein